MVVLTFYCYEVVIAITNLQLKATIQSFLNKVSGINIVPETLADTSNQSSWNQSIGNTVFETKVSETLTDTSSEHIPETFWKKVPEDRTVATFVEQVYGTWNFPR